MKGFKFWSHAILESNDVTNDVCKRETCCRLEKEEMKNNGSSTLTNGVSNN